MIERLKNWLLLRGSKEGGPADFSERQLAAATLLVEAALLDGEFGEVEERTIRRVLRDHFTLSDAYVEALLSAGRETAQDAVQLQRFTAVIKRDTSYEERISLIEMLWEVAYADGVLHHYESNLLRRVGGLLYVSDRDRGEAAKRVRARLGLDDAGID